MKKRILVATVILFAAMNLGANAQLFTFNGSTSGDAEFSELNSFSPAPFTIGNSNGTVTAPINSDSPSTGYTNASGDNNIGNAMALGTSSLSLTNDSYFQTTLQVANGYVIYIPSLSFGAYSTSTGSQDYSVVVSTDDFAGNSTVIASGTIPNDSTWTLETNTLSYVEPTPVDAPIAPLTVRIYGYGGTGSPTSGTINTRLDDIQINAYAEPNYLTPFQPPEQAPEPSTWAMLLGGLGLLAFFRIRTHRTKF